MTNRQWVQLGLVAIVIGLAIGQAIRGDLFGAMVVLVSFTFTRVALWMVFP